MFVVPDLTDSSLLYPFRIVLSSFARAFFSTSFFFLIRIRKRGVTYPEEGGGLNLGVQVSALSEGDHLSSTPKEKQNPC